MKILLIAPSEGKWKKIGKSHIFNGKAFRFSLLSLLRVAAETPPNISVRIVDEQIEDIPWNEDFDLVGITCMTALALRAYDISSQFREKGTPVVLGGMHPTLCSQEALAHANAVVVGDVEGIWSKILQDAKNGNLQGIYKNERLPELVGLKPSPRHLLKDKKYATVQAIQASRGCINRCDFCSVSAFHNQTQRFRPVDEVVEELSSMPDKFIIFVDDNLTADRNYAMDLFKGLIPLKKKWVGQSTLSIADDTDLIKYMADSGCIGLFVGLESFTAKNLNTVNKTCHQVEQYKDAIRRLHDHGINVEAGIVLGFDNDDVSVFSHTLDMLRALEVDMIQASIFTPLPGTARYQTLKDRIMDHNWSRYDFHSVVFQPRHMSAKELQAGHDWLTREFYRPRRIFQRLFRQIKRPGGFKSLFYVAALNFAYFGRVERWNIRGYNPAKAKKTGEAFTLTPQES